MSNGKVPDSSDSDPLWQRYEVSVRELLSALDPDATVRHNAHVQGRLSQVARQIDVWAEGTVIGQRISVAVECKLRRRPADVQIIDAFIGKLLDIGADRGVIYSSSGFSDGANMRAYANRNPSVLPVELATPQILHDLRRAPGYPADLLVQDIPPHWVEDLDEDIFAQYLKTGEPPKFFS
ncbi:restriction endonuclease [Amycolatopsis rhabdoformis]|uniref:restriction endonuclease n=1 Tax=Amycolatopsis rhabdoformis TaxID=1448059 RepID=UPI0038993A4C